MTTLTFQLTPKQLADPVVLQKLQELSEALKPKVPTPEEIEAAKAKRYESNKFLYRGIASAINSQIEKRTGKKVGITDRSIFELFEIGEGQHDFSKILTTWMLPLYAFMSDPVESVPSTSASASMFRCRSGPSLSRRGEAAPTAATPEEERSAAPSPAPTGYSEFSHLMPFIEAALNIISSSGITSNDGLQNLAANIVPQFLAGLNPTPSALPTNPTPEQMLSALFSNIQQ